LFLRVPCHAHAYRYPHSVPEYRPHGEFDRRRVAERRIGGFTVPRADAFDTGRVAAPDETPPLSAVIGVAKGDEEIDRLLSDLDRWAADSRATDAARARSRQRWLRRQATELGTLSGVALDLAERRERVILTTTSGNAHRGRILALARDVWVLRSDTSGTTFVAADAIASLRAQPGSDKPTPEAQGDRPVSLAASMAEMLTDLAADQPRVRVVVTGEHEAIAGQLRSVGADVMTLRVGGEPPTTVYVRLGSVSELSVLGSG
jgi:hypothetical protein